MVSVPVRLYCATEAAAAISFNMLHAKCGSRLKQQMICSEDGEVVPRSETLKGYEIEKGKYVTFTEAELKALEEKACKGIEIDAFVPLSSIDPTFYDGAYFLSPDKGGDRAFALLASALDSKGLAAIGRYSARGKGHVVAIRAKAGRLVMHQLLFSDEVRSVSDVPVGDTFVRDEEAELAGKLVDTLRADAFDPERYRDEVRERIRDLIGRKAAGKADEEAEAKPEAKPPVDDLMAALRASLSARKAA